MRRATALALLLAACLAPAGWSRPLAAASETATSEALADRAFAEDDYESAEAHYREALRERPDSAHAMSRLALLLTWRGEYKEAIDLYRKALDLQPGSTEARRGLATAYTWSEDYDSAIGLYRQLRAESPDDEAIELEMAQAQAWSGQFEAASLTLEDLLRRAPDHLKGQVLMGQTRLWQGDYSGAERSFTRVLAADPDNIDALNGMGRVHAAAGRYVEAQASYDRVLTIDPNNRAAMEGRAEAYHWEGRTPEALAAVRQALERYPDARDARRLGHDIGGPLRPSLQLFGSTLQDSDDNDLGTWGGTYTDYLGGRGYVGATFSHSQAEALNDVDTPVAKYDTMRLIGGWTFSDLVSLYGDLGPEATSYPLTDLSGAHSNESQRHLVGSLTLEVNPARWLTLVGSASQERLVTTTQAFMNDIGIGAVTGVAIFRPHDSLRMSLTGQVARLTDNEDFDVNDAFQAVPESGGDSTRDLAIGSVSWATPLPRPHLTAGYTLRWMSYDQPLDAAGDPVTFGYFGPDHFVSNVISLDLADTIGRAFYWGAGADIGLQRVNDQDEDDVFGYRFLAGVNVGDAAAIEAYYARTDLAQQTPAGFQSSEGGVRIKLRFGQSLGPASPGPGSRVANGTGN